METSEKHYRTHLGPVYSWMLGDLDAAFTRGAGEIDELPLPAARGAAVDLGAGLGLHALPLAKRGFDVVAIDSCQVLLDELRLRAGSLPIAIHNADLLEFRGLVTGQAQVIVCMGDTLTHLQQKSDVSGLFNAIYNSLVSGGIFVLTWRDLITELHGVDRFIPVRSDENTIMTCFLEYSGPDKVTVYDLVYTRTREGWTLNKSSYHKLRLSADWITRQLEGAGLTVEFEGAAGRLLEIIARKP
jgi:SAM-dependent methyltransferase